MTVRPRGARASVEVMEARLMLSATAHATAAAKAAARAARMAVASVPAHWRATPTVETISSDGTLAPASTPLTGRSTPGPGLTANAMRIAYGLAAYGSSPVTFAGVEGDGQGMTIGIVDFGDDPYAFTDINTFSTAMGLPLMNQAGGPTFTKLSQTGTAALPSSTDAWTVEESLDIEWAHAFAPLANIILFETRNAGGGLTTAVETAAAYPGVVAVSMSYGGGEYSSETSSDAAYTTPAGHAGVTFLASTGDDGTEVEYPAGSRNVVAVGGTELHTKGGAYGSESGWSGSGGGVSAYELQPGYQAGVVSDYSTAKRTVPDVSIDADPGTGVPICDSFEYGADTPWLGGGYVEGGTSLACPLWAGLIAVTDQGRAADGLGSLDGPTQTLPRLYQLPAGDFHDVTDVENGSTVENGGVGYDLNTGIGSPIANQLLPDLAGGASVAGLAFADHNADGTLDGTDVPLAGQTVYLDLNNDGVHQATEPTATVGSTGGFRITSLVNGGDLLGGLSGTVRLLGGSAGYVTVGSGATFTTSYAIAANANVDLFPIVFNDASAGQAYALKASSATTLQVVINGTVADSAPIALVPSLTFNFTGSSDALAVDFGNGDPVPSGGVSVDGSTAADGDTLTILGNDTGNAINVDAGHIVADDETVTYANVANLIVDPRSGLTALNVNANAVVVPAQVAGGGILARRFDQLAVAPGAKLTFATAAAHADRSVVILANQAGPTIYGSFDLGGNDMVVRGGSVASLSALAAAGYDGGAWDGIGGLDSAAANANGAHTTALAVAPASAYAGPTPFDGQVIASTDVLIKYTYDGDVNLDGVVNLADYTHVDVGFITPGASGWSNGDLNYDGKVDGSDYALIDAAFAGQTAPL